MVLPVLLITVFGTIEVCQRIFLRQSAVIAAYEGARLCARGIATNEKVKERCNALLNNRGIKNSTVAVTPSDILTAKSGTELRIRVEVPWADNSPTRFVVQNQGSVVIEAVMLRE